MGSCRTDLRCTDVLSLMHGRAYYTGGWGIFIEQTWLAVCPKASEKYAEHQARQLMRIVEGMCGYAT